jgi:hypothetical protein
VAFHITFYFHMFSRLLNCVLSPACQALFGWQTKFRPGPAPVNNWISKSIKPGGNPGENHSFRVVFL